MQGQPWTRDSSPVRGGMLVLGATVDDGGWMVDDGGAFDDTGPARASAQCRTRHIQAHRSTGHM